MLRPSTFQDLLSGRRRGPGASALRLALRLAEVPYTAAVRWRNRRYDLGTTPAHRAGVPVVSVGNLTLGGTGKTPMVRWIAEWLCGRAYRVAVISRGYGSKGSTQNDEASEFARQFPGVPQVQNPNRVAAVEQALDEFNSQIVVLDDAFQHRRIGRDLDVVLLDATEPFGYGHVFPRGTLREPIEGLGRADVVVLTRADVLWSDQRKAIRQEVRRHAPEAAWAEARHAPQSLLAPDGNQQPLESLRDCPVAAFCGIGNPAGFQHTLESCGYRVVAFREFADHHRYRPADVESLAQWAAGFDVSAVLTTGKDLVKLDTQTLGPHPLMAVTVGLEFFAGQSEFERLLAALLTNP